MDKKARFDLSEEIFSSELFKVERGFSDNLLSRGGGNIIRLTVFGLLDQESSVDIGISDPLKIADELAAIAALIRVKVTREGD